MFYFLRVSLNKLVVCLMCRQSDNTEEERVSEASSVIELVGYCLLAMKPSLLVF